MALVSRATLESLAGSLIAAAAPAPAPTEEAAPQAAAVPTPPVGGLIVLGSFGIVGAGLVVSWLLWTVNGSAAVIRPSDTSTVFAGLLVFAAAVERLLEPFARWMPGRAARAAVERARAYAVNQAGQLSHQDLVAVAEAEALAARSQAVRTVLLWGVATAVATVISSLCGFYVLHGIAAAGWDAVPVWADALVTGVLVGSGTKPVHDLITRAQVKA
ncbi:hypothetical protein GCM10010435_26480 [Winogradskya consettensis]|uniref:Uncharacterized protein n=1 Tax=Winogradskya consettensis TaxID=113560 RepID=A0A919SAQ0_9ACTN|nr:hypothetical protein [Actinoplanes consettensis]GIM68105.1 hypothetical protein Aco04nite_09270 [Actinoplanes consettensis]